MFFFYFRALYNVQDKSVSVDYLMAKELYLKFIVGRHLQSNRRFAYKSLSLFVITTSQINLSRIHLSLDLLSKNNEIGYED